MKILTVCSSSQIFGAETITLRMLAGLKARGHDQVAVTSVWTDGQFSRRLGELGIREVVLPFGTFSKKPRLRAMWWTANTVARLPRLWSGWNKLTREFQPDIVLWTSPRQPAVLMPWLKRLPTSFLIEFTGFDPNWANRGLYRMLASRLTGFVAVSDFMIGHLQWIGAPRDMIYLVRSGAFFAQELREYAGAARIEERPSQDTIGIGIVGQIAVNKGHDDFVDAIRLLRSRGWNVSAYVFGTGDPAYLHALKSRVKEAGLSDAWHWMGYETDKGKIYRSFDICVVPSVFGDPFPTVAMEAGAYGLPVVATRAGGLPEIVEDGVTGWLAKPRSPTDLAEKIESLLSDRVRASGFGAAGRERILKHFTVEHMIENFETLFASSRRPQ